MAYNVQHLDDVQNRQMQAGRNSDAQGSRAFDGRSGLQLSTLHECLLCTRWSEGEHSSSSSSVSETDVKGYAFKYKERFRNYTEQIATGETKGWLTPAEATTFKSRLDDLRTEEAAAGKNGYPADAIAALDKAQTKFNEDLTSTMQKPKTSATATESKTQVEKKVTTH